MAYNYWRFTRQNRGIGYVRVNTVGQTLDT